MLVAIVAIIPLLLERIHNEEIDRADRIEAAYKQALDVAREGAAEQNEVIASTRALLQVIASTRATFNLSDDSCNRFLAKIAETSSGIKTLSVANVRGQIVCSANPNTIGLDISERPHFAKAIDTAGFVLSDYYPGTRIGGPLMTLALAQRGENDAAAAVVLGVLDLSWFARMAKNLVPPTGTMLMVDGKGTLLARYPSSEELIGRTYGDNPLVRVMLARPEGLMTATDVDGVRRIFGYVQLPGIQARIAFGLDEKDVLASADREMWMAFGEMSFVAVLVLLGIWFGGERLLVRPISALAETAVRIGHGDTKTHAADLPWAAEFVPLAAALDDMADKLRVREQELRDSNKQLRDLAQLDALTGLGNRRSFNERLTAEWAHARAAQQPIAVLMIDVDYFKLFNDHYGHVQGDCCLRKVGDVLKAATRERPDAFTQMIEAELSPSFQRIVGRARRPDFAARYGGEEFAVLLQGADLEAATAVAERLRQDIEDLLIAHAGAAWGFVSISVGAASMLPLDHHGQQELTEAADAALYQAKRHGRNCVVAHKPIRLSQSA